MDATHGRDDRSLLTAPVERVPHNPPAGFAPRCRACQYDLTGLADGHCPECGASFTLTSLVAASRPCPLWAILAFTFIGSLGSAVVTTGIFFIAKHTFGFTVTENYLLGLLEGVTYMAGALGAGPAIRWLRTSAGMSTRGGLVLILLALASACVVPLASGAGAKWAVWALMAVYAPVSGAMWPIVEGYVSGGRSGSSLRSGLGRFNIVWSSATVVGICAIAPLVEHQGGWAVFGVAVVHIVSMALLPALGSEPARHIHQDHEPHPPVYGQLLITFRVLLPTSYLVVMALSPFLPTVLTRLEVSTAWQTPMAATWMLGRLVTFAIMERWHGWHGRWYPAVAGIGLLLGGFGLAVLCPHLTSPHAAIPLLLTGLAGFGVGMATIYAAALYYAMEVGQAEVEAGGKHEALIGLGYTGGPTCGLLSLWAVQSGVIVKDSFEPAVLVLVGTVAAAAGGVAAYRSWKAAGGFRGGEDRP
jgi:hypothetical protein